MFGGYHSLFVSRIDLLAIRQKSLDQGLFLSIFIHKILLSSVRFYHYCAHSKILQNVAKYQSIQILFQNS